VNAALRVASLLLALLPQAVLARELPAAPGTIEVAFNPWDDAEGAILRGRAYLSNWRRHRADAVPLAEALPAIH
jgi:hypothetical protein